MKSYVFTDRELKILKAFVERKEKLEGWRDLKYRISKHHKRIREHHKLMEQAIQEIRTSS